MDQDQPEKPPVSENVEPENTEFPSDEAGLTTSFDKSGAIEFTENGPEVAHIVPQDEFWDGVKNADQTPRDVASTVPTDVPEPAQPPEDQRDDGAKSS